MNSFKKKRLLLSLIATLTAVALPASYSFADESAEATEELGGVIKNSVINHNVGTEIFSDIAISDLEAVGVQKGLGIHNSPLNDKSTSSLKVVGKLTFNNITSTEGGAIYNGNSTLEIKGDGYFRGNKANSGGAIMSTQTVQKETSVKIEGNNTFISNASKDYGGAIYNSGSPFLLKGTQVFQSNSSGAHGGAVANLAGIFTIEGDATFSGNLSQSGGALSNVSYGKDASTTLETATFEDNSSTVYGGAVYNSNAYGNGAVSEIFFNGNATFKGNHSLYGAAIASVFGASTTFKEKTEFFSNGSNDKTTSGGALFNWSSQIQFLNATHFEDNKANWGGAITNYGDEKYGDAKIVLAGSNNDFLKNKADTYGGAIYNNSDLTIIGNTTFVENKAKLGGALYNLAGNVDFTGEVNVFKGNISSGESGAIHNVNGTIRFSGENNIFEGNEGGAIRNSGGSITLVGNNTFLNNRSNQSAALVNEKNGVINLSGTNSFEGNTKDGKLLDIENSADLNLGTDSNPHIITTIGGGISGNGKTFLNQGALVLRAGSQIHQGSFIAKSGTVTTITLSESHFVHDRNIAHFDELADENGTGHDKVANAVGSSGFGIHTTGEMTLEKGAVLNIVSDDIQAGHTYLVAYNEAMPEAAAQMVRAADTSVVINPAGFDHDETSWKGENLISSNPLVKLERVEGDNTNGYILVTSKNSNSISIIEDLAGLDQVYFSWLSDLEDLRQRLGEVRLGADNGIWTKVSYARYRASGLGDGKVKSTDYSIHVGADGTLYKNNGHKFFAGFSFKGGHTDMKAARAAGTGDLNHYTWKLYGTYVHEKGSYADIVASVGTFNNRFRGYHDSWTGQVHGDVNNWGAGISGEVGHQFRFLEESAGSFWFAEPQIQLSYFRVKGKNYETSNAIHVEQKSVNFLTGRVGVSAGKQFAYGADKKRYLQLSAKAGLIHEFAGDQKLRLNEKKLSADGKKNLFYYGADMDWQFADNHKLYLKVDRATGSGYRKDIQIQGGYRYSF